MVKTSRKTSRKANLRQVIRPNLGKRVNLRSNIQQSLVKHNFNTTTTDIQNNFINSFSSQRFEQIGESSNLTLPSSPSLPLPSSPSPPSPSPPSLSPPSQTLQHENDNLAAEDNQENYSYDDENYYWESESDNDDDGNYSWKSSEDSDSDNQENYSDGSDEEISFTFKDQYDGFQDTPSYSGEAGPYFPNKTVMLMFIWYTKHMIGTHAYQDLIKILKHPDFRISELPLSITTLKKMRRGLPLMTLNSHDVKINPMDTPSTTLTQKEGYTFSLLDHIQRILKNPFLFSKMYFGPGVEASEVVELWEGQIWKESPIFGETSLLINNVLYQAGDFIIYIIYQERSSTLHLGQINGIVTKENKDEKFLYIQEIVYYSDLPKNLKSYERLNKSKKSTVWLTERRNLVNISNVINHVKIWLKDLPEPLNYDYQIDEILYVHNNRSKVRQITRRHRLTYYKTPTPPSTPTKSSKETIAKQHGLRYHKNILDHLIRNRHIQTPQDPYHCLAGLDDFITRIKNDFCLSNKMQVPGIIVNCWVKMAKACKAIFKSSYIIDESYNDYIALSEILEEIYNMLLKVFGLSFSKLPNMHVLRHLPEIAVNFDGGLDERYDNIVNNSFSNIGQDPHLCRLLNDWYIKTSDSKEENTGIFSIHPDFGNIRVYGLWKPSKIHKLGLSSTISENNLLFDLTRIYEDIYQNYGIIIQRHINYYDFIYFTVLHENYYSNITLRVGEVIDVEEEDNSNEQSYALIRAIILHQDDYGRINPFLLVDWFYRSGNVDSITGLPIYYLQESNDSLWSHLHPLIIVDRQPKVHFVHKCTRNCLGGSHDKNNKEYILNEFYYLII
ncbi:unnamed protein product [Rhizophagus irregularis]|nr:unnamed protein product [Rhizophagus irregularis]